MIDITEADYRPLETFIMAWRWTDSHRTLLPSHELANIRPLTKAKADEIADRILVFRTDGDILPVGFDLVDQLDTSDRDAQLVRNWLLHRVADPSERLIVFYDAGAGAVVTTRAIFCDYWDDFYYPISDDVIVVPLSETWVLSCWHEYIFYFGQRRST